jgi:hypothetical protein
VPAKLQVLQRNEAVLGHASANEAVLVVELVDESILLLVLV